MKLEAFHNKEKKKKFIIGFTIICIALVVGIFLYHSYAWFTDENTFNSFNGNVTPVGDIYFSVYVEDEASETIPSDSSGYVFNHGTCTNGANVTWDNTNWEPVVSNLTVSRTKCTFYFNKPSTVTLAKLQHLNSGIVLNTSMNNQSGTCPTYEPVTKTIQATSGEDQASLLCKAEDDFGDSYYFRGNVTNNYVSFAGFIWRIVRINGDGSVRLIYDGDQAYGNIADGESTSNGVNRQIGTAVYNSTTNDNAHVGYMYKATNQSSYANTFDVMNNKNATSSTIKGNATTSGSIDYWYAHNIDVPIASEGSKKYSDFVSLDAIYCNDKKIATIQPSGYTTNGYGTEKTAYRRYYGPWLPSDKGQIFPSFTCINTQGSVDSKNDAFSVSSIGNGALTYPVALLTTDEVEAAGANNTTISHYLRTGNDYWTMSPACYASSSAYIRFIYSTGKANNMGGADSVFGVRPVLSLKPDVEFASGDGTMNNPFEIVYN